jgi:hypothetical protein
MNDEDMKIIGEELLEWCGFKFKVQEDDSESMPYCWQSSDGKCNTMQKEMFFYQPDLCLMYLIPKLLSCKWKVRISFSGFPPAKPCVHLSYWGKDFNRQQRPQINVVDKDLAMAISLAAKKAKDTKLD